MEATRTPPGDPNSSSRAPASGAAFAASGLSLRCKAGTSADGADSDGESRPGWFYSDRDDAEVQHGPFDLEELRSWFDDGHFEPDMRVRQGRAGEGVTISDALGILATST